MLAPIEEVAQSEEHRTSPLVTGLLYARQLMNQYGLTDWELRAMEWKIRIGECNRVLKRISISSPMVRINTLAAVREVTLHEIAHALTRGEHDAEWKAKALELGASGGVHTPDWVKLPTPPYEYVCMARGCGMVVLRWRRVRKLVCRRCRKEMKQS